MNASFAVQDLLDGGALVSGTDVRGNTGAEVITTTQWDLLKKRALNASAAEQFNQEVERFFKPLTDAAEVLAQPVEEPDELSFVVLNPALDAVEGAEAEVIQLTTDSIILRILEEGSQEDVNRLIWVAPDDLAVLKAPVKVGFDELPF